MREDKSRFRSRDDNAGRQNCVPYGIASARCRQVDLSFCPHCSTLFATRQELRAASCAPVPQCLYDNKAE